MRSRGTWPTCTGILAVLAIGLTGPAAGAEPATDQSARANAARAASARVVATADARVLQEARQLLAAKQAEDAYQLLAPHEYEWAGDRDFDYLLGAAAVDSGRPSEGVLALQRALATDPEYSAARMELARAYYNLGDYDQAAAEFRQLQLESPPDYARRVIENYLLAIDQRKAGSGTEPNFRYYLEFDFGYDTNANGSTDDETISFFGVPGELDDRNIEQDSFFVGFSHGGIWTEPLTPQITSYSQFGFNHRRNASADFVNSDRLSAATSLNWRQGDTSLTGTLGAYLSYLDSSFFPFSGDKNSHAVTLDLGARQALGDRWLAAADLRYAPVRYGDDLENRDVDQTIAAVSLDHFFAGPMQARVGVTLIAGHDRERDGDLLLHYGRSQTGVRISGSWLLESAARAYVFVTSLNSDYDTQFIDRDFTLRDREDDQRVLGGYIVWRAFDNPRWALVPRLVYVDNDSDVSLYEYDRTEIGLAIRWLSD